MLPALAFAMAGIWLKIALMAQWDGYKKTPRVYPDTLAIKHLLERCINLVFSLFGFETELQEKPNDDVQKLNT